MIMSGNEAWTTLHKPRRSYYYYYLRSDGTNTSFVNWRLFRVHSNDTTCTQPTAKVLGGGTG